jgi:lipopolysaccharide export system protein LptA
VSDKQKGSTLASAAQTASAGEIHVKTSGLIFNQKSGVATTDQRVEFALAQGAGSAMGASYDSQQGLLIMDRAVELNTKRGAETVQLRAQHAEFERGDQVCLLRAATASFRGGQAVAADAKILFREDGSAIRLDAAGGFALTTATGGHLTAPTGTLEFDKHNQPRHGHLEGGVAMDSASHVANRSRQMHGTSPTAELDFTAQGELRHAHLERGVEMHSEEQIESAADSKAVPMRVSRSWRSPVADLEFRDSGHGQVEPATIHGIQGVVVTSESRRGGVAEAPSRLAADDLTGQFGKDSALTAIVGVGHTSLEETTATGTRQATSGDRLEAHFAANSATGPMAGAKNRPGSAAQIQSATMDGHVVLVEDRVPVAKPGVPAPAPMRATAGKAVYEGTGEWVHLTLSPRVEDGGLQLTAERIDFSQASGDAFAHGNVKATWIESAAGNASQGSPVQGNVSLGGQGPTHVVAAEAQLSHAAGGATGEATFRGQARLWQQANSVAAPVIVLDRVRQTLVARATDPAEPVRVVLLSAGETEPGKSSSKGAAGKPATPSVIRMRGGDLKYSDAEHKAVMLSGSVGNVVAETGTATSTSREVDVILLPPGNHAAKDGGTAQVDRMTARGHVVIASQGRRGTGEQLEYASETGEYVLTGTSALPPRMTDPARGTVTGEALTFDGHDDSVSIEGGGRKTMTETRTPK